MNIGDIVKIDKLVKMKNNKYKIYIDGEYFITYDDVILDNGLLYKKEIDKEVYNKIINDVIFYDIYNKVLKYCLKKIRSEKEVVDYLNKFNLSEDNINKIILKLKNIGIINDIHYARAYINDKIYLNKMGINKIRVDLLEQNIPIDVIEEELKNIDQNFIDNTLEKLILKRINTNHKYSKNLLRQKILSEMINLGYSKESIIEIIDNNLSEDDYIMNKEFDKIYNKLKKKYNGEELNIKIKQKMISKGFSIDKINELVQKNTGN